MDTLDPDSSNSGASVRSLDGTDPHTPGTLVFEGSTARPPLLPADAAEPAVLGVSMFIRATAEQPWPEPPAGGTWSRNAETGDLTLIEPSGVKPTPEERDARRKAQREQALAAANKTNSKE
jgi:hypothetical protein